jgi:hypothetical protein
METVQIVVGRQAGETEDCIKGKNAAGGAI